MFRNIIFDWSGTLCDDMAITIEATNFVLSHYNLPPLDRESFRNEFQLPYPDYYAWKTPHAKLEDLENYYRESFDHSTLKVTPIPHAREFLDFCRRRGIRCFILTSMDPPAFEQQVREMDMLHFFEHIHSGIRNKEHYIPTLMKQHGLLPHETAFVGDMQHDITAAHCAGITAIGVQTGYNNVQQLAHAEPHMIIPHLGALRQLMEHTPTTPQESINLHGLELMCNIGITEEERSIPQRLTANIALSLPAPFAGMQEDITRTIDYALLTYRLRELAGSKPYHLVETLAHELAMCCVQEFHAPSATIEVHKYILPEIASCSFRTTVQGWGAGSSNKDDTFSLRA